MAMSPDVKFVASRGSRPEGDARVSESGTLTLPIYDEGGTVPLAEAGCGDAMLAGLVAPEEDELQLLSSIEAGPQVFE